MEKHTARKYSSPIRERQANQTRTNILDATQRLFLERGYAKTTVEAIAQEADISKAAAAKALDGMMNAVTAALKKGDTVTLVGFGTFYVGERAERQGRNPKTGEPLTIAAAKTPKFRAGKALKDAL